MPAFKAEAEDILKIIQTERYADYLQQIISKKVDSWRYDFYLNTGENSVLKENAEISQAGLGLLKESNSTSTINCIF